MNKDKEYYDQFNNCDDIKNLYSYFTVLEAALIWCGIPNDQLEFEVNQCYPKGDDNGLQRNTFIHPYVSCVEPRCLVLHQAFEDNHLAMGRDGGISGLKDTQAVGHIAHARRTIKIADLKSYIREYHSDNLPKTLFSEVDISKANPITHEDYLTLKAKNEALEARLEKAVEVYQKQKAEIAILKEQQNNEVKLAYKSADDLKDVPHQSYRTLDKVMYAIAKLTGLDNSKPYSQNMPSLNAKVTTILQNDGIPLEYEAVGKWLSRINDVKPLK